MCELLWVLFLDLVISKGTAQDRSKSRVLDERRHGHKGVMPVAIGIKVVLQPVSFMAKLLLQVFDAGFGVDIPKIV